MDLLSNANFGISCSMEKRMPTVISTQTRIIGDNITIGQEVLTVMELVLVNISMNLLLRGLPSLRDQPLVTTVIGNASVSHNKKLGWMKIVHKILKEDGH